MTHDEHCDDVPDLTASEVVIQFGDEIRAAIAAVAHETPTVAKSVAQAEVKDVARRSAVRWYAVGIGMTVLVAAAVAWLVVTYAPRPHASHVSFQYGGVGEVCARVVTSPDDHPVYVCDPEIR